MAMVKSDFVPPLYDRQALALAYLAYLGEKSNPDSSQYEIAARVWGLIQDNIPNVPVLTLNNKADWEIVWGPSFQFFLLDQQNMMYVVRQKSKPNNYMVVVRGTNFGSIPNWVINDFEVKKKVAWNNSLGSGMISEGTDKAINALLVTKPLAANGKPPLPGYGSTISDFLKQLAKNQINIRFCGHSLAGCLSPVMALLFAQTQGLPSEWDPNRNATIAVTAFAGPTPGDSDFANYYSSIIANGQFNRYHDLNDVVPLAWNKDTYQTIPDLYPITGVNAVEEMTTPEKLLYATFGFEIKDNGYTQMGNSIPFIFPVNTQQNGANGSSFAKQMGYQHHYSYPSYLDVPQVITILANNK